MLRRLLLLRESSNAKRPLRLLTSTTALALRPCCILAVGLFLQIDCLYNSSPPSSVVSAFTPPVTSPLHVRFSHRQQAKRQEQEQQQERLTNLRVPELKDRLRTLGLKVSGRKSELIERLESHYTNTSTRSSMPPSKRKQTAASATGTASSSDNETETFSSNKQKSPAKQQKKKKKAKAADHQRQTERTEIPKLWDGNAATEQSGSYTMKIMSWNVAGLRALLKNHPDALPSLARDHGLDVIALQEIKLQETHVTDPKLRIGGHLLEEEGYDGHYSCSTTKKGYSGTAVFVKRRTRSADGGDVAAKSKKQATLSSFFKSDAGNGGSDGDAETNAARDVGNIGNVDVANLIPTVSYGIGKEKHDGEGRSITLDFPLFTMTNLYVPNSGQKLERLSYRTKEWDSDLLAYMQKKEKERNVPVIWLGDLNVAHTAKETWNEGAKHLVKSAGTTPEERASFEQQLDAGYVDAFRELHPDALGHYSYWSQRAGNREPNKGLRLDYFVCSKDLLKDSNESQVVVRDSYMIPDQKGSDHCPLVLELEIKC